MHLFVYHFSLSLLFFSFLSFLDWLEKGTVKKLVLVITGVENEEVLERSVNGTNAKASEKEAI